MEQLGGMIGLNKREIITMAIHDFLKRLAASLMNLMLCQRSNKWPCSRLTVWSRTSTRSRPVLTAKQVKCGPSLLRAQILCENIMESGEKKLEMVTLKVHTEAFKSWLDRKSAFQLAPL